MPDSQPRGQDSVIAHKSDLSLAQPTSYWDCHSLAQIRRLAGIKNDAWDAILFSDGAGTRYGSGICIGWAAVLIQKSQIARKVFCGADLEGTVNEAEILAVLRPLQYLAAGGFGNKQHGYRVHVFSDSKYVCDMLNRDLLKLFRDMKKNLSLWMAIHGAQRAGLAVKAHFIERESVDLNRFCDQLSRTCRLNLMKSDKNIRGLDPQQLNP